MSPLIASSSSGRSGSSRAVRNVTVPTVRGSASSSAASQRVTDAPGRRCRYMYMVLMRYGDLVPIGKRLQEGIVSISASEARQRLFPLLEQVNTDHEPVRITSRNGDAVLMSADDFDSWQETVYLLRSPENARRLMEAVVRDRANQQSLTRSIEELEELAGGSQ